MLVSVLGFTAVAFSSRLDDFVCFQYTGPRPATLLRVLNKNNYTRLPINTPLDCSNPKYKWCGFCITISSRYYNSASGIDGEPLWDDLEEVFSYEVSPSIPVYLDPSLDGSEVFNGSGATGVTPFFEAE